MANPLPSDPGRSTSGRGTDRIVCEWKHDDQTEEEHSKQRIAASWARQGEIWLTGIVDQYLLEL